MLLLPFSTGPSSLESVSGAVMAPVSFYVLEDDLAPKLSTFTLFIIVQC